MAADHITIRPAGQRLTLSVDGLVLADSAAAQVLTEGSYPPVIYVPRDDVAMDWLRPHPRRTHCPWKGEAAHFSALLPERKVEIAAWSYETPLPGMEAIAGHIAFYLNHLQAGFTQA